MENILEQQKQQQSNHPMHYQPQLHHTDALQHQAVSAVLGMSSSHQQSPHSNLSSSPYHLTTGQQSPDIKPNINHLNSLGNSVNGSGNNLLPNLCVPNSNGSPITSTSVAYHTQSGVPTSSLMYNQNDQFNAAAAAALRASYSNEFDSKIALNQNLNSLTLSSTYGQQLNNQLNNQLSNQLNQLNHQFNGTHLPGNNSLNSTTPNYLTGTGYPSSNLTNCSPVGSMMSNGPLSPNGTTRDSMGNLEFKEGGYLTLISQILNFIFCFIILLPS